MTEYNIEVEILYDEGVIRAYSNTGLQYEYSLYSEGGAELLNKIFGTETRATVYSQDEEYSLEEWEALYG